MKHPSGFVPIDFVKAGKILFFLGSVCLILKGVDFFTKWIGASNSLLIFGLAMLAVGVYLLFVVPRPKE